MKSKPKILIIDSDSFIISEIVKRFRNLGFTKGLSASPDTPISKLVKFSPDLTLLGPTLDSGECLRSLQRIKIIDPNMPILVCCTEDCLPRGEESSPFDNVHCIGTDLKPNDLSRAIEKIIEQKAEENVHHDFPFLVGQNREIQKIRQKARIIAGKDVNVLISGESGTGKELIARSIHQQSKRSSGPLVKVNCTALPDDLLESELFGFQKGALTGAHDNKRGLLEMANHGTLFIDEIGELSLPLQVKFLQILEGKVFSRLGGLRDQTVDTRVLAATNSDLRKKMQEGYFRKDLFYRLNISHIMALPLRERKDDIPLLTDYFIDKYCYELKRDSLKVPDSIMRLLQAYQWPGNVRELQNVIRRAIVVRDWDAIFKKMEIEEGDGAVTIVPFTRRRPPPLIWEDKK